VREKNPRQQLDGLGKNSGLTGKEVVSLRFKQCKERPTQLNWERRTSKSCGQL